jgi:hypothetical protein
MFAAVRQRPNQPVTTRVLLDATALLAVEASEQLPAPRKQTLTATPWPASDFVAPPRRTHLIPYAVGPPARGTHSCPAPRAAETADSRVSSLFCPGFSDARPIGAEITPSLAGLTNDPSSALRGEPIACPSFPVLRQPALSRQITSSLPRFVATTAASTTSGRARVAQPSPLTRCSPALLSSV